MRKAVFFAAALLLFCGCVDPAIVLRFDPKSMEPVRIGITVPLTGPNAGYGKQMLAGARYAVDELNSKRGHFGRPVDLVVIDTTGTPAGAARAAESAAAAGAIGIIAGYSSGDVRAIAPKVRLYRIPAVVPMATGNDDDLNWNRFLYRTAFTDQQQSEMIAAYLHYYRKIKRIAVLVNKDNSDFYSRQVARDTAASFRGLGGEVVGTFQMDVKNPEASLREMLTFAPQAIVLPFEGKVAAQFLKKLRGMNYHGIICGPESWDDVAFFQELEGMKSVGYCFYTALFSPENRSPEYLAFRDGFRKKCYYYPGSCEIQSYDAVKLLLIGFGSNGTDMKKFDHNIRSVRKQQCAAAIYTMEKNNKIDRTIYINNIGYRPEMPGKPYGRLVVGLQYSKLKEYINE